MDSVSYCVWQLEQNHCGNTEPSYTHHKNLSSATLKPTFLTYKMTGQYILLYIDGEYKAF